ncbi:AAA-ATPase-like domain-containing protein [Mycena indigotica]|uniref:AAA-ATPase-like domain-containing protein n=1 Tax=Mycena indigotica TaxID=2126181 RepID=A0A8H6WF44_9AGAR|nr:AAA-ATPase-like domain-containing protein [Mycena indigotica]KAF7316379.1 AAA-ATPase-like domain-containing protein [Mycena indigotica]
MNRLVASAFNLSHDILEPPRFDDLFEDLVEKPGAYVDKTGRIAHLPTQYTALMIRPPRFGKTTFVSTLAGYYDTRNIVPEYAWERLDIYKAAKDSFASRERHLCLMFCFPGTTIRGDFGDVEVDIRAHVSRQLYGFFKKYFTELGLSEVPPTIRARAVSIEPDVVAMFAEFWSVVKQSGHTLFVCVDDYDAPVRSHELFPFDSEQEEAEADDRPGLRNTIEELLDRLFWEPLLHGIALISKLLVTGNLSLTSWNPEISKSLSSLALAEMPELSSCCGFTEDEARSFSAAFLPNPLSSADFRDKIGQYHFPPNPQPLLHPQQIIRRVAPLPEWELFDRLTNPFPTLSAILRSLEDDADDERVTRNTLLDLLTQGTIEPSNYRPLCGHAIGVDFLRDLGILSYDSEGRLRVASKDILQEIHSAVDSVVDTFFSFSSKLRPALWVEDGFTRLLALSTQVLVDRTSRGLSRRSCLEPTMHGVLELLLRAPISWKDFYDPLIMVPPSQLPYIDEKPSHNPEPRRWGPRTLTLRGLWRGSNPNNGNPTFEALAALHEELRVIDEVKIRRMLYLDEQGALSKVSDHLRDEPGVNILAAVGGARVLMPQMVPTTTVCEHCGRSG